MTTTNRDSGLVEVRRFSHHQYPASNAASNRSKSPSPQLRPRPAEPYSIGGTAFHPHPLSHHTRETDDRSRGSNSGRRRVRPRIPSSLKDPEEDPPLPPGSIAASGGICPIINAELKVSLAAKHLASQIKESKEFWTMFQRWFDREVTEIKPYAGDNIIQQLWRKKIEHESKLRTDDIQIHQQFSFQQMKLEACVDQINKAATVFNECLPGKDHSNHNSRQLALDKIRAAGSLVLKLAARSALNNSACTDLVTEASSLEKLVDPESSDAHVLHRFDRHETKSSTQEDATQGDETQGDEILAGPSPEELDPLEDGTFSGGVVDIMD
ncbi:hypothetical protein Hte_009429 [Hypoxylon texense]